MRDSTELLPVNEPLVAYARAEAERGRRVVVATAANRRLAAKVCSRFSFIGEVIASSENTNLKGRAKSCALQERFPAGFAYAGDASVDAEVWRDARFGIFAGRDPRVLARLEALTLLEANFAQSPPSLREWVRAARLHQWAKNGLVFLPLLLAGHVLDAAGWMKCAAAFLALGLTASATYLINDLLDLDADRQHWAKRNRALASGRIGIPQAIAAASALLVAGLTLAFVSGGACRSRNAPPLLRSDAWLFASLEARPDPRRGASRRAVHDALGPRRGRRRRPAVIVAGGLLDVPVPLAGARQAVDGDRPQGYFDRPPHGRGYVPPTRHWSSQWVSLARSALS